MNPKQIEILSFLAHCKMATSRQIARLLFHDATSIRSQNRRANLLTKHLKEAGLIYHQPRKIGGWIKGSSSYIWSLTSKGVKTLQTSSTFLSLRPRSKWDATQHHIEHTLAVTEIFVQLKELEREQKIQLEDFQFEPKSWRTYADISNSSLILKPDAFAKLVVGEYEDIYFFELDRSSESLTRIANTSKKYIHYYKTGIEQRENDIFPLVLWIVPDEKRKIAVADTLQTRLSNFWQMFHVITLDDFADFIQGGQTDER